MATNRDVYGNRRPYSIFSAGSVNGVERGFFFMRDGQTIHVHKDVVEMGEHEHPDGNITIWWKWKGGACEFVRFSNGETADEIATTILVAMRIADANRS